MSLGYKKKMIIYFLIVIFFLILDRFFKFLAISQYFSEPIKILDDIFKLSYSSNYNIAFSLPISGLGLNLAIIVIILALFYYLLILLKKNNYHESLYLAVILLGACSNLFDRLRYGFVIDYLDLKYFTVFNIADMMIVGGVLGIIIIWAAFQTTIKKRPK
ncbi:MAG: signal peptidase II [Patescibacteria group bacterium]